MPQTALFVICGVLLATFLFRVFQGVVSRTVALPAAGAVGLGLFGMQLHPGVAVAGALVTYWVVGKVVETSIRWAVTLVMIAAAGLLAYGFSIGKIALP